MDDVDAIGVRLSELSLRRPRQWGACWLALQLWQQLELDSFWRPRLARAQGNTPRLKLLKTLVTPNLLNCKRDANADTVVECRCAASIGVSLATVGAVFGLCRTIDIPIEPMLGLAMDRTRTRFGRFRLWTVIGAPLMLLGVRFRSVVFVHFVGPAAPPRLRRRAAARHAATVMWIGAVRP